MCPERVLAWQLLVGTTPRDALVGWFRAAILSGAASEQTQWMMIFRTDYILIDQCDAMWDDDSTPRAQSLVWCIFATDHFVVVGADDVFSGPCRTRKPRVYSITELKRKQLLLGFPRAFWTMPYEDVPKGSTV